MDPTLIAYINNIEHRWKVCFDVPYATLLWQVEDWADNNRIFKSEFYHTKDELLLWKYEQGLTRAIKHENIMPLLNDIFQKAFGQEEIKKKTVSSQGWKLINQNLVEHPSISVDCNNDNLHSPQAPSLPLNFENVEEIGASMLDRIMME